MAGTRRLTELSKALLGRLDLDGVDSAVVGLSGGADSTACAWLLQRAGIPMRTLHIHHGLPTSDEARRTAGAIAERLGVPLTVRHVSVDRPSEGSLRAVRYDAFQQNVQPGEWIVTAHTSDDQAETVFHHIIRGTGLDGLAGIPARRGMIARPMLSITRSETRELVGSLDLPVFDDPMNADTQHLRTRVRRQLIPLVEASYNQGFREHLVTLAGAASVATEALESAARGIPINSQPHQVEVAVGAMRAVPEAIAVRVVQRAYESLAGTPLPSSAHLAEILGLLRRTRGGLDLPASVRVDRVGPMLRFTTGSQPSPSLEELDLPAPGSTVVGRMRIDLTVSERRGPVPFGPWAAVVPFDDAPPHWTAGRVSAEDRMELRTGSVSAHAVMRRAGLTDGDIAHWPVVRQEGRVVWIPGVRRVGWEMVPSQHYLVAMASEESMWQTSAP